MRNGGTFLAFFAAVGLAGWFIFLGREVPVRFEETTRIVFKLYPEGTEWVVQQPEEVGKFVGEVQLVPKHPCKCKHNHRARFMTRSGKIDVWFCDHCFDVYGRNGRHYQMPTNFYAKFLRCAPAAFRDGLREPPPEAPVPVAK